MAETKERKIPVFTVSKNGAILKNIFIVNRPPDGPSPQSSSDSNPFSTGQNPKAPNQEMEETLVVGRHPDCDIMLTHPSISRFHLQIYSKHSSQKLSVVDLSSVHGTWVSEMKIEPGLPVELNEGDTLRIGGSTRVYRLHWMPMSQAYEVQSQFVSPKDLLVTEEKEEENAVDHNAMPIEDECVVDKDSSLVEDIAEASKDHNALLCTEEECAVEKDSLLVEKIAEASKEQSSHLDKNEEIQLLDVIFEGVGSLFSNCWSSESECIVKREIPSAPPMPENLEYSICNEEDENPSRRSDTTVEQIDALTQNLPCVSAMKYISGKEDAERSLRSSEQVTNLLSMFDTALTVSEEVKVHSAAEILEETENQKSLQKVHQEMDIQEPFPELLFPELMNSSPTEVLIDANLISNFDTSAVLQELEVQSAAERLEGSENQKPLQKYDQEMYIPGSLLKPLMTEVGEPSQEEVLPAVGTDAEHKESQAPEFLMTKLGNSPQPEVVTDSSLIVNSDTFSVLQELEVQSAAENHKPLQQDHQEMDLPGHFSKPLETEVGNSSQTQKFTVIGTNSELANEENQVPLTLLVLQPPFERGKEESAEANQEVTSLVDVNHAFSDQNQESLVTEIIKNAVRESTPRKESETFYSVHLPTESVNSSLPIGEVCFDLAENENRKTSESVHVPETLSEHEKLESSPRSEKRSNSDSLWSRRGKPSSALQIRTVGSTGKSIGAVKDVAKKLIPQSLFLDKQILEDDIFTPDKENFTPNTLLLRSLKRKGKLEQSKDSPSPLALSSCTKVEQRTTFSPIVQPEDDSVSSTSDKENQTPKVLEERKPTIHSSKNQVLSERGKVVARKIIERNPLQCLPVKSRSKSISEASASSVCSKTTAHTSSNKFAATAERRNIWTMVVDITSLMDKESRKTLQLLQGLKGTRLVIPRTVIRELDSLNRRGSLFRRKTEAASVLEWIEDSISKTKWWIHVQSSIEEETQLLPTPRVSPQSQFNESLTEINSPTAEDHIVDCALRLRATKKDGQLVLLSNDVTIKIKAMAEGLLCETVQEFRESLVNPFSDRFLWAESSPRGQTWSCLDDVVLRERYNRGPSKKSSKGETAKGLKLILLHNSQYGKISSSIR